MGIKGTVRRNQDSHVIHSNVDTDIIVAEEFPFGSTRKPDEMYSVIEHFCLVRCPESSALLMWHAAFPVACLPGVLPAWYAAAGLQCTSGSEPPLGARP